MLNRTEIKRIALLTWAPILIGVLLIVLFNSVVQTIGTIIWVLGIITQMVIGIYFLVNREWLDLTKESI